MTNILAFQFSLEIQTQHEIKNTHVLNHDYITLILLNGNQN